MILNRRARVAMLATFLSLLTVLYIVVWLAPAVAADHESGVNLVLAKALAARHGYVLDNRPTPVPETSIPPVFPALLALFAAVSTQAQWLKLLPLLCAVGWLALTRNLLLRMGASWDSALLLIGLVALSPAVIAMTTRLTGETLFALLAAAALIELLEERALAAGLLAGFAALTVPAGAAMIPACVVVFAVRGRFRSALIFAGVAMVMVAPWFGWSLSHLTRPDWLHANERVATNILTGLAPNEKVTVAARNLVGFFNSPISLFAGLDTSIYTALTMLLAAIVSLWVRRQMVPDLFVTFYGIALLFAVWPPTRAPAAVLPLILWIAWRALRKVPSREFIAALVLILAGLAVWADAQRVPKVFSAGVFPEGVQAPNDWRRLQELMTSVREKTSPGSVLLANLDGAFFLNTGRKSVRGYAADGFNLYYSEKQSTVTPDQLSREIALEQVNYVVLTPDRGEAEAVSFHGAVEALERGGVLRPVEIPGAPPDYRLLHVDAAGY